MKTDAVARVYAKQWRGSRLAGERFDVASLLRYLKEVTSAADFNEKVCRLLRTDPTEAVELMAILEAEEVSRRRHNAAPDEEEGELWTKMLVLYIFEWVTHFLREDTWRLVAEILDVARLIGATAEDLQTALHWRARFDRMKTKDWQIILESGATSFGEGGGHWDVKLFEKHVRGQSTG